MRRNPNSMLSFFKVLINDDFNRQLRLPPAFVKKWGEISPQFLAQLRISSGEMWRVKLEKQEDQNYYIAGGWAKFCEDLGLAIGEFVVFWYTGRAIFDVSVYGINGCERKIAAVNNPVEDSDPDVAVNHAPLAGNFDVKIKSEDEDAIAPGSDAGIVARFSRKLDSKNSTRLDIPKDFVLSTGIGGDKMVNLQDSRSRLWPVQVESFPRYDNGFRFALTAGWNEFLVGNKVAIGNTVLLECEVPGGSLLKAKVLNKGSKGSELFQLRRGRPSNLDRPLDDRNVVQCKEECVFF